MMSRELLTTIESILLGPSQPSPSQRVALLHTLRNSLPLFQSLLSHPPPKQSDRARIQSKEVTFADSSTLTIDDQDVQIASKLSDELYLNEVDCVQLLMSVNEKWALMGREPLEIFRLASGLWYTDRRNQLTALYMLLRAVVLDQGDEVSLQSEIQNYCEELLKNGLRKRIISLIKVLNRKEPSGLGGPYCETYVVDDRGALVDRHSVVLNERLILGHCLVFSLMIVRASPDDVKDIFDTLKDCAREVSDVKDTVKIQITYALLFSLIISLVSDALGAVSDKSPILSCNASFRKEFQEMMVASYSDSTLEGFVGGVRLAWSVHLMLIHDENATKGATSAFSTNDIDYLTLCLELAFSKNVFEFLLVNVIRTAAYMNDDEDVIYLYNSYLHKLIACFLSHPLARSKIKEAKDKAMGLLYSYNLASQRDHGLNVEANTCQVLKNLPFVSLLDFVSGIYQMEPEPLSGNDSIWSFVNFSGEDHNNFQTLVAFLNMLSTMACTQDGASKVYELLQGKTFRAVEWSTFFKCLAIYDEKFKESLQTPGAMLPDFPEGDAKALVAYLNVIRKVVENGPPTERGRWFPDVEPFFKLLCYESVPPYVKGALRDTITTFVQVFPSLKITIWSYIEQYDLPVVSGTHVEKRGQPNSSQVYDMQYELNEVESRLERYPSTVSFLNLLNALIMEEKDLSDRGRRYIGIFRFVCDHVFGPFPQRAYADSCEKWQLVVACLQFFYMMLSMYDVNEDDVDSILNQLQLPSIPSYSSQQFQLPVVEIMKDFLSGNSIFRNIMGILLAGVDHIISERTSQIYGNVLEKAVQISLDIFVLVFQKDSIISDFCSPLYQPLDVVIGQNDNQVICLLQYVRYGCLPQIQLSSIKIMSILSSRIVGLVQLLLKSAAADSLVEDYSYCLELRSKENQIIENREEDPAVLIMQLLIDNVGRPAPNVTHLLLGFDLLSPVERTVLQPKFHYSCLKVVLEILENMIKPDVNAPIHEFGLKLLYELCVDPVTSYPTMELLSSKKYHFFIKHLDSIGVAPLPKRSSNQALRISSLHQRAWLLKLLAVELHMGFAGTLSHREACKSILMHLFSRDLSQSSHGQRTTQAISKSKALELLDIVQFRPPDILSKPSLVISNAKYDSLIESILENPSTAKKGGVYRFSERGDRLIELNYFSNKIWEKLNSLLSGVSNEAELIGMRETIQNILRWAWKHNINLEEQAAQLHMLTGWSLIVEVSVSRRVINLDSFSEVIYQILDASLGASASPDCSLKMAFVLTQVTLTCMAKLRDERFLLPSGLYSDNLASIDMLSVKHFSNGACHSFAVKLIMAILRNESSEALRRCQYSLLLSYFQYCRYTLDPDIPQAVLQFLLVDEQDTEDLDFMKVDREQAELDRENFLIFKKEAKLILDLVIKDALQGSERGRTIALYVLDALICIDHERYFLTQLQSRGFLRSCLESISSTSNQDMASSLDSLQRACGFEALFALLLRISHRYGTSGMQILFSMGALEHINLCGLLRSQGRFRHFDKKLLRSYEGNMDTMIDSQEMILTPILRLVFSFTALIDSSDIFEVKSKVVRDFLDFVKSHQQLFDPILRQNLFEVDEISNELIYLVGILSKVWSYEENDEFGFVQGLFSMMISLFSRERENPQLSRKTQLPEVKPYTKRKMDVRFFQLCFSLSTYLYSLVSKKSLTLQVLESQPCFSSSSGLLQPTLTALGNFLSFISSYLNRITDEKSQLLSKIRDINELSRQEVDEIIDVYSQRDLSSDDLQKRRYIAITEMCQGIGFIDELITLLLLLAEYHLNIIHIHFHDGSITDDKHDEKTVGRHNIASFFTKLVPTLELLEELNEDKVGSDLRLFKRLVTSLKEIAIQKMATH